MPRRRPRHCADAKRPRRACSRWCQPPAWPRPTSRRPQDRPAPDLLPRPRGRARRGRRVMSIPRDDAENARPPLADRLGGRLDVLPDLLLGPLSPPDASASSCRRFLRWAIDILRRTLRGHRRIGDPEPDRRATEEDHVVDELAELCSRQREQLDVHAADPSSRSRRSRAATPRTRASPTRRASPSARRSARSGARRAASDTAPCSRPRRYRGTRSSSGSQALANATRTRHGSGHAHTASRVKPPSITPPFRPMTKTWTACASGCAMEAGGRLT